MLAIYLKELRSYFINAIGYVYIGIFLAISALLFCYTTLISNTYITANYFSMLILVLVVLIPLLTMKLFAEEKKLRTEQMLLTAPVSITGMVLGKYFAAFTMYAGSVILSCINFLPLYATAAMERSEAGQQASHIHIGPSDAQILGSLVGILFIGAVFIAVGMFISTLTENQLAAAVITIASLIGMLAPASINNPAIISSYAVRFVIDWFNILSRFANFSAGKFDFAAIFYYISLCSVFVFATVRVYDKRRWG